MEPSWRPLTALAMDGGDDGKSDRESLMLIQSRKVPSALLATLAMLRQTPMGFVFVVLELM